jgi:hypothetical protein
MDLRKRMRPQEAVEQLTDIVAGLKTRACGRNKQTNQLNALSYTFLR